MCSCVDHVAVKSGCFLWLPYQPASHPVCWTLIFFVTVYTNRTKMSCNSSSNNGLRQSSVNKIMLGDEKKLDDAVSRVNQSINEEL